MTEAQNALFDNIQEQNQITLQPQIEMLEEFVDSRGHSDVRPRTINQAAPMTDGYNHKRKRNKTISMAQTEFQLVNKIDQYINENESQAMTIMKKNNDLENSKQMLKNYFKGN